MIAYEVVINLNSPSSLPPSFLSIYFEFDRTTEEGYISTTDKNSADIEF